MFDLKLTSKLVLLLAVFLSAHAHSNPLPIIDWQKRQTVESRLTAYGDDLLGDSIDRHLGSLVFEHTDVSIPGNSALDVSVRRRLSSGYNYDERVNVDFADWDLVVPRMTIVAMKSESWKGPRCNGSWGDSLPDLSFTMVANTGTHRQGTHVQLDHKSYSNGLSVDIPGQGSQSVLKTRGSIYPAHARASTASEWYFTCTKASDGGEGFIGHAPNGDKYTFTKVIERPYKKLGFAKRGATSKPRVKVHLAATQVRDVNNNWVKYSYDNQNRLTRIHSNDGRNIELGYSAQLIASITTNNRTWSYEYRDSRYFKPDWDVNKMGTYRGKVLSRVILPDNNFWSFSLDGMQAEPSPPSRSCDRWGTTVSLTHPHGVTGNFKLEDLQHRQAWKYVTAVADDCFQSATLEPAHVGVAPPGGWGLNGPSNKQDPFELLSARTMSVVSKKLSAPSIKNAEWGFEYQQQNPCSELPAEACKTRMYSHSDTPLSLAPYVKQSPSFDYVAKQKMAGLAYRSDEAYPGHDPIDFTNWTKVTMPNGSVITHYHLWRHEEGFGGKEIRRTVSASGKILDQQDMVYAQHSCNGSAAVFPGAHAGAGHCPTAVVSTTQQRDGDTYRSTADYNMDPAAADFSYGKPVTNSVWSNVTTKKRITKTTYEHNTAAWMLGLPKTQKTNNRLEKEFAYNSKGQLTEVKEFGHPKPIARYGYHADGNIKWFQDGNDFFTYFYSHHRGIPKTMKRADGVTESRQIDNNGWVTQTTDANGNSTGYDYDIMGRVKGILPPDRWLRTDIDYDFSNDGVKQTVSRGDSVEKITYDAMFRSTLEHTAAMDTGWYAYVNTEYNASGQAVFKSQPSQNKNETKGLTFSFDALGRIENQRENVYPYAETKHQYMSWHKHRIYDPANNITDYYSYGYGGPNNKDYRAIYEHRGSSWRRKTFMSKNEWGELYRLRQVGSKNGYETDISQYFAYDKGKLCSHYAPEHGTTKYAYDNNGKMVAYAKGQSTRGCGVPNDNSRVDLKYDAIGRLLTTNFRDPATPDITRTYDNNGNVLTVNRGGINWTYAYNSLNKTVLERLAVDGRTFNIENDYNDAGYLKEKTLPSGGRIVNTLDGLGRTLNVEKDGSGFANDVNYHPSGLVHTFTYGNGQRFTQTLNERQLPKRITAIKNQQRAIDQTYGYNNRGKITTILDGAVTSNNRVYSYDGLGQLTSAIGSWGLGTYIYDGTGNLRQKKLGTRTVDLTYNTLNKLTNSVDTGASGNRAFGYDTRGNITSTGNLNFTYDRSDQPTQMTGTVNGTGSISANYQYDGNLKRVKSSVNGKTIYNVFDQSGALVYIEIEEADSSKKVTEYVSGPMGTLARITNNEPTYLHADNLGSAQSGTDANGNVVWREQYTPFGESLVNDDSNKNLVGFAGHIKDDDSGLNYMQARYFDPVVGRFMSIDPKTFADTGLPAIFNRYSYTFNDPVNMGDPDGELPVLLAVPILLKGIDAAITAYDIHQASKVGAGAVGMVVAESAALSAVPGGKIVKRIADKVDGVAAKVTNPVPETLARVVSDTKNTRASGTLGVPGDDDVFVTAADDIAGLNAAQIAEKLTIKNSATGFRVTEFPTPKSGVASPVNRANDGFVGKGKTAGGAREFVIPNGDIPTNSTTKIIK